MKFGPTAEQDDFAAALDDLLGDNETVTASRAWAGGDHGPGLALWGALGEMGVTGLCIPEESGGLDAGPTETVIAFEQLGRHLVPGPLVESLVAAPALAAGGTTGLDLDAVAKGTSVITLAAPPTVPLALDADAATERLLLEGDSLHRADTLGHPRRSVDPARRLFELRATEPLAELAPQLVARALDAATLATAAQLLGMGERMLDEAVAYAKTRQQFGRPIGEYQALKHAMADVRIGLDFARPLLLNAALSLASDDDRAAERDVSAAKITCSEAAYRSARTALQVHGGIGYTQEHDLGLWLLKVRALVGAWGTLDHHRARVLRAITAQAS